MSYNYSDDKMYVGAYVCTPYNVTKNIILFNVPANKYGAQHITSYLAKQKP